jgi:UDP-N-acetylglucosamine diphosphorylase/glucosamine-1-phosphate N-acetyltransferase
MRVCLFEDRQVDNLEPLTLTRPAFALLSGQSALADKQCGHFRASEVGVLVRPHLASLYREQHPNVAVNDLAWLRAAPTLLINGRWLPPAKRMLDLTTPWVALAGQEVACAALNPEQLESCTLNTFEECLETWRLSLPCVPAGGRMLRYLWEFVQSNAEQLDTDYQQGHWWRQQARRPEHVALVGPPHLLWIEPSAQVDAMVLVDTTRGPVVVDRDAIVSAFTRLEGPCFVGAHSQLLGAKVRGGVTIGPHCRIGGEVEASIIQGHTNKYHDGFLGHSYVGEWVNLAAGTQCSDLRNDYGEVSVPIGGNSVATGAAKVGCFLGDHTKTGLGTLLNTGTNAGVFCNLLPAGKLLPKYFPSFTSWWNGQLAENSYLPALLQTAEQVMRRRDAAFTQTQADFYCDLFKQTAVERRRAFQDGERFRFRRSA